MKSFAPIIFEVRKKGARDRARKARTQSEAHQEARGK